MPTPAARTSKALQRTKSQESFLAPTERTRHKGIDSRTAFRYQAGFGWGGHCWHPAVVPGNGIAGRADNRIGDRREPGAES